MSYLIVPNIICFQTQKQLTTLNNIWYYIYMHVNSYMHPCQRAHNLSSPANCIFSVSIWPYNLAIFGFICPDFFTSMCHSERARPLLFNIKLLSRKRLWMSYLIVPNIICFQTQKQLATLHNIWYYIYMHVNSCMQKHLCVHLACSLVKVCTICRALPTASFMYQYDVIIW